MPVLLIQAVWVRLSMIKLPEALGERSGTAGSGKKINLLIIGDSASAGVGTKEQKNALSGQLVANLATTNTVNWQLVASTGLTSTALINEIENIKSQRVDFVLVSIGVNDVTGLTKQHQWVSNIKTIVDLCNVKFDNPKVLMTALPPMHLFTGLLQPLRWWLGLRAKKLNELMILATADNSQCCILSINIPFTPKYLAQDGFHPSSLAYSIWAEQAAKALKPST
ncbi:MAG: lysophospholipase L1-like esterase [Colwellia sp.]|jgi:lysophospholipase L1-like esterase